MKAMIWPKVGFLIIVTFVTTITKAAPPYLVDKFTDGSSSESSSSENESYESKSIGRPTMDEYLKIRNDFIRKQNANGFENDVNLNDREQMANGIIMNLKTAEIQKGLENPKDFAPSRHIFEVLDQINNSTLFSIIKQMPKGGILHAHDTAMCSTDFIISLTYREHLWQCSNPTQGILHFIFSSNAPTESFGDDCVWSLVADARTRIGQQKYDDYLRTLFSLYTKHPQEVYTDINVTWQKFSQIFAKIRPIATYAPVWKDYFKEALRQCHADGVQYVEFRGLLPDVYDLDGRIHSPREVMQTYVDVLKEFKADNPDFIGSKFIYAPSRLVSNETINEYIEIILELHKAFPEFLAGYDFVGQEDLGRRLIDFVPFLLKLPSEIQSFFHAGETNWFGETDENLIDAVLLGAKRIGHGYALSKHPTLLKMIKDRDIVIEINPISNQVLKLVEDYRNHPAALFFADNIPLVVSSDDYSFWETAPLSHDFYLAFLGIASSHSDLRTLKKLATNSIRYSALSDDEKRIAFAKWQPKWDQFIEDIISGNY